MLECYKVQGGGDSNVSMRIVLCFQERQRSRFKGKTQCEKDLSWFLERGQVLADGDVLLAKSGERIAVVAAEETVSVVQTGDPLLLARAAYHLGNRHVPLQVEAGELRYQHDHVLDDMLQGLGLTVIVSDKAFHPESGAYHNSGAGSIHSHHHHD
ncbi:MAG: urease accessory protein [Zhongshania sp.]|jgi:urease accessory protein